MGFSKLGRVRRSGSTVIADQVYQATIRNRINCTGVGLHSGSTIRMCLRPAPAGTGIIFRRTDIELGKGDIPARFDHVTETVMCTTLGNRFGTQVSTVEHLMSAFYGCSIDNAIVELDGPEVPIMDGSAGPFLFLIESAGRHLLTKPRRAIRILKTMRVSEAGKSVELAPSDHLQVSFRIDFDADVIASQSYTISATPESFRSQLARARTFGFMEEVEQLRAAGFARGGSLDNAVVIESGRVLNEGGLRYRDEFVRHKVLDAIGDLYLAGGPVIGHYRAVRGGHSLNHRLLSRLFADTTAWEYVPCQADTAAPVFPAPAVEWRSAAGA